MLADFLVPDADGMSCFDRCPPSFLNDDGDGFVRSIAHYGLG